MSKCVRYKMLRADGSSVNYEYGLVWYPLPRNGKPGAWIKVPGNGCYAVPLGGDLFARGPGEILVELECRKRIQVVSVPVGVHCFRDVRVLHIIPWIKIPATQGKWRYQAACHVTGLTDAERRKLVLKISPLQGQWRYQAAYNLPCLTEADRRKLVLKISRSQGQWRYQAAYNLPCLTEADRRELQATHG